MTTPFVGRTKETQLFASLYDVIIKQLPHKANLVLVEGEAGSGKSTLIAHFIESIKENSVTHPLIAFASCEIFSKETSFLPFFQLLDNFRTQQGSLSRISNLEKFNRTIGEVAPAWLKMVPVVGEALANTIGAIRDIQEDTYQKNSFLPSQQPDIDIYGQFLKILIKLAENHPVMIVVDDLQWADEESARLFTYLARRLPEKNHRIMLIGAYRPYDIKKENVLFHDAVLDLEKRAQARVMKLPSFTTDDLSLLFESLYGLSNRDISIDIRQKLITHTAGNPLFITELLKHFEEDNKIVLTDDKWHIIPFDDLSNNLPESLEAALEQRIEHLEKRLKELLTIASIEGESFTAEVLSKIKNIELVEVLDALVEDLSKTYRLVRESGEVEIALNNFASLYAFRHGLIRDYIYRNLSPIQKRLMHQQVGDCLENLYGDKKHLVAHQLANHFLIAKDYLKLAQYGLIVARQEFEKYSPKQALWWAKTAYDAINHIGGHSLMAADALLIMIQAHVHLGQNDDALSELEKLESISHVPQMQFAIGEYLKGEVLTRKGEFETAINSLRTGLSVFKEQNEIQFAGWALRRIGHIFAVTGNFQTADENWQEGLNILDKLQDLASLEVKGVIWSEIAEFSVDAGDMVRAEKANHNALDIFQKIKNRRGEAITLRNLGGIEFVYGNLTQSEALTRRALEIFKEIEDGINIIWSSDNLARTLVERGDSQEAKAILAETEPIAVQMNEVGFLPEIYIHLSEIALLENKPDDAFQYALRATQIVASDDQYSGPRSYCAVVKALLADGKMKEAEPYMNTAWKMVENSSYAYVKAHTMFEYAKFLARKGESPTQVKNLCDEAKQALMKYNARRDINKILAFEESLPA